MYIPKVKHNSVENCEKLDDWGQGEVEEEAGQAGQTKPLAFKQSGQLASFLLSIIWLKASVFLEV